MKVGISSGAEADVADGYWFYERQSLGLGDPLWIRDLLQDRK